MSIILNNSRDVGNKFLFGHFMMKSSLNVPPTKHDLDVKKAWVYCIKNDKANDYGLGGEVFAYPGAGKVEDRTWRILDGSDDSLKIDKGQLMMWIAKEMIKGANGIAIWVQGWTNSMDFLKQARSVCDKFKVKIVGICHGGLKPSVPDGASGFEDACKKLNDIFDSIIIYNWEDNWISFKDAIESDWKQAGYTKPMASMQDAYRCEETHHGKHGAWIENYNDYAVWKNLAGWSKYVERGFCLYNPKETYSEKPIRLSILKRIMTGEKTIPEGHGDHWGGSNMFGPGDPANPLGPGQGTNADDEDR